jgi:hypothetical protein
MRPFARRRREAIVQPFKTVESWLSTSNDELRKQVDASCPENEGCVLALGWTGLVVSAFSLLMTIWWASPGPDQPAWRDWPIIGWIFGLVLVVCFLMVLIGTGAKKDEDQRVAGNRAAKRAELEAAREADVFYQRAKMIEAAAAEFFRRCDRYAAWFAAVEEDEVQEPDEAAADQYRASLIKAAAVLEGAIGNFNRAIERAKRQAEFERLHPAVKTDPDARALGELISLLDGPVDAPTAQPLPALAAALDHDAALEEAAAAAQEGGAAALRA